MPSYNYSCPECGYEDEFIVPSHKSPDPKCANKKCKKYDKVEMTRLFSPTKNFILKGKGWASDGYSKKAGVAKQAAEFKKKHPGSFPE